MNLSPGQDWILATTNRGKLAEFRDLLSGTPIRLHPFDGSAAGAPEETGFSFVENALIKARHAAQISGRPAVADDSGLCVAALDGAPGIRSARYAGARASDRDNLDQLLADLAAIESDRRQAAFHCVIVAVETPEDPAPIIASGRWPGRIASAPRGVNGFGYDPVFFDPVLGKTAAELSPDRKNVVSHRGRACLELKRLLDF